MTTGEESAIEQQCARLVARYANLNDAAAWRELSELYAEDGRMARPTAPDEWIVGRQAILAAFESRPVRLGRHLCTNIVIDVIGKTEARGECAMALFLADGSSKFGSFHDRFVRTGAGWRFAERRGSLSF